MKDIIFEGLINNSILSIQVGKSTGSIVGLSIGKKEVLFGLMIYCTWRLDSIDKHKPITGWNESNDIKEKTMAFQMNKIKGDVISDISLDSYGDFNIKFNSQKVLKVFCDITSGIKDDSLDINWVFFDYKKGVCYSHLKTFEIEKSIIQYK